MNHFNIDGLDIPFDSNWSTIAISMSGGADSALLTYLLCDYISSNDLNISVHIINHIRCWKTKPWQQQDADRVYNWLVKKFYSITFVRHTNFIAPDLEWGDKGPTLIDEYGKHVSGDNIQIRAYAEFICYKHNLDAYYNAVTRNPKNVDFKGMPTRDIEPLQNNEHLRLMKHMDKWAIHPFRFVEKNWIYKQYKTSNILDLWNSTRSCEGIFENINYKNYIPYETIVPECGECFWCKERKWAQYVND